MSLNAAWNRSEVIGFSSLNDLTGAYHPQALGG
jgi:hypothetical protein